MQQPSLLDFLFPLALLGLSATLLALHIRKWHALGTDLANKDQQSFHRLQLRRRIQASAMIGLLGVAIAVGMAIPWQRWPLMTSRGSQLPLAFAGYWLLVILVTFWIVALALADLTHSRSHIRQLTRQHQIKRAELEAQLQRHRAKDKRGEI